MENERIDMTTLQAEKRINDIKIETAEEYIDGLRVRGLLVFLFGEVVKE